MLAVGGMHTPGRRIIQQWKERVPMKAYRFPAMKLLTVCILAVIFGHVGSVSGFATQDKGKDKQPQVSEAESKALAKIESAADANAKVQAASEFIKKYPKSTQRANVVSHVVGEIARSQDAAQKITLLENLSNVFNQPSDSVLITPILLDAYKNAKRFEDLFRAGSGYLAKNPNDLPVLTQLTIEGVEQAKAKNTKFLDQSREYGVKAIALIEAGNKPDTLDDARWASYQTTWLPQLYQALGIAALITGNKADAKAKVDKASSLNSSDPFNYFLLGMLVNEEYQQLAEQHKSLEAGPLKDTVLKQAQAKMDQVIELDARVVALSEGRDGYQQLHDQILQELQSYYKYRHGSTDGLQQLIDKYKKK
jgi:hypothetical protein